MLRDETIFLHILERIAKAFEEHNRIEREKLEKQYPKARPAREAEITRTDDDKREQFTDRAEPQWYDETEAALPESKWAQKLGAWRQDQENHLNPKKPER